MARKKKVNLVLYGEGVVLRFSVPLNISIGHDIMKYRGHYYKYDRYDFGVAYYKEAVMHEIEEKARILDD